MKVLLTNMETEFKFEECLLHRKEPKEKPKTTRDNMKSHVCVCEGNGCIMAQVEKETK